MLEEFVCFAGFSALLSPRQTRHKTTAKKNKSHLLKEIFLICHVQGQDVPKNVNFQNTAGDQKSYPNLPMNMTWERLILLSISKKRPKQQFSDRSSSKSS